METSGPGLQLRAVSGFMVLSLPRTELMFRVLVFMVDGAETGSGPKPEAMLFSEGQEATITVQT